MFNVLRKREQQMESSNNQKIFEAKKQIEEMKKEMQLLTSKLSKTSEDLKAEKIVHAKTKEAFEEVVQAAEEKKTILEKDVDAKDLRIEELLCQLKASKATSDELSAALCLSQMRSSQVDSQENLFEELKEVCKKMDDMT